MVGNSHPIQRNFVTITGNLDSTRSLIFVHGFGTDQSAWAKVAEAFLADFRIILFDQVGAGNSESGSFSQHRYLSLAPYAKDMLDICRALEMHNAIVVGHSVGAMVGMLATIECPELFTKLVMIGASPRYLDDEGYRGGFTKAELDRLYTFMMDDYPTWADHFAAATMANPQRAELAQHFATSLKSIPQDRALTVLCSIFQSDHRADLQRVSLPTLLLQSQEDFAVPLGVAEYLHEQIRGSRLRVIQATGHFPHISAPDAVIAAISDFINDA